MPARDPAGNLYIVRVLAADPVRPARDLQEVRMQVERDWLLAESMKKAREAADKFLAVAREKGLAGAAKEQGIEGKLIQTDLFSNHPADVKIANYELPDAAREKLVEGAFDLLQTQVQTGKPNPVGLIELPKASRVVVARLDQARPADSGFELELRAMQTQMQYAGSRTVGLLGEWFDPESLQKRTKYEPDSRNRPRSEE
jgi:hypothetical protein